MKTPQELEQLRGDLIDVFYAEGKKLAGWDSNYIAGLAKDSNAEEVAVVRANASLISSLGTAISNLSTMMKQLEKKEPPKDVASDALAAVRNR